MRLFMSVISSTRAVRRPDSTTRPARPSPVSAAWPGTTFSRAPALTRTERT